MLNILDYIIFFLRGRLSFRIGCHVSLIITITRINSSASILEFSLKEKSIIEFLQCTVL